MSGLLLASIHVSQIKFKSQHIFIGCILLYNLLLFLIVFIVEKVTFQYFNKNNNSTVSTDGYFNIFIKCLLRYNTT